MKIALIGDIHGNLYALKAVLKDAEKNNIEEIIYLGDYVMDGPQPNEVIDIVKNNNLVAINGNKENTLLSWNKSLKPYDQFATASWTYNELAGKSYDYIKSLHDEETINIEGHTIKCRHNPSYWHIEENWFTVADTDEMFENMTTDIEIFAHSHFQLYEKRDGKHIINPGAVGMPIDGDNRSHYAIIEINSNFVDVEFRKVKYDINEYQKSFIESDIISECKYWSKAVMSIAQSGDNYQFKFVKYANEMMENEGASRIDGAIPNDIWNKAGETFNWPELLIDSTK
jgi:putative phosphoesterase